MKTRYIAFLVLGTLSLASCMMSKDKVNQTMVRIQESSVSTIATPLIVEYDMVSIKKAYDTTAFKIQHYANNAPSSVQYNRTNEDRFIEYRKEALENAVNKHNCDVIINPAFRIFTDEVKDSIYVIVIGHPATYKTIRQATKEDAWMIDFVDKGGYSILNSIRYEDEVDSKSSNSRKER